MAPEQKQKQTRRRLFPVFFLLFLSQLVQTRTECDQITKRTSQRHADHAHIIIRTETIAGSRSSTQGHKLYVYKLKVRKLYVHKLKVRKLYIHKMKVRELYVYKLKVRKLYVHKLNVCKLYIHKMKVRKLARQDRVTVINSQRQ
ncbi:hypothetical protein JOB18_003992 [Solea senegalensis]|uniref:Secreted protein n=1 Tax=Solea senegalensis TaxID=28829 RepID=A0AAV6QBB4_SOLSE|nr:hypothetical protein JOB18_003992 [Solea senegalensis]